MRKGRKVRRKTANTSGVFQDLVRMKEHSTFKQGEALIRKAELAFAQGRTADGYAHLRTFLNLRKKS